MAKSQIRQYVFTPGAAGAGTIKVPGKYDLNQLLIITNTTRNIIYYNFADTTNANTVVSFSRANDSNFTTVLDNTDGITTITLAVSSVGHNANDTIQIFFENPIQVTRPWEMGTDAFERTRVSEPTSMLDADFEYGLQTTKWQAVSLMRGYPSIYEIPGTDLGVSAVTTNGAAGASLITVTTSAIHEMVIGQPFTIKGLNTGINGFSRAEGSFTINTVPTTSSFTYWAKASVGITSDNLFTTFIQLRKGGFYTGASISAPAVTYTADATPVITLTFPNAHGLLPGSTIISVITSDSGDTQNHKIASGPYFIESVPTPTSFTYTARAAGVITGTVGITVYARPDSFYVHRPHDGGVILSTGGPSYGAHAIRMSKKYIRYQSGKAINYNTGALFAPNYDLRTVTASATAIGSTITVVTDEVDHNLQVGATVSIVGIATSGYENTYDVATITDERTFTVIAKSVLGSTTAQLSGPSYVVVEKWSGSVVRAGTFDDQNGQFWQYDGQIFSVGKRSSTFQLAGIVTVTPDSNLITGSSTRFTSQLTVGDRIVVRGMTHVVTTIPSDTQITVTPDYRGTTSSSGVKIAKTIDYIIPQSKWNGDRCDGSNGPFNPSGFRIEPGKMQMIGLQWTWYGAGFIDWMLRGPDGKYIFVHRLKGNNLNREAYMRSGNLPVRYEVVNEGPRTWLTATISSSATVIPVEDLTLFPNAGTIYIDNELIRYSGRSATSGAGNLTGATRATNLALYTAGSTRTFTAGIAATHATSAGVLFCSQTATPNISHWGSAFLQDGGFDQDRGYLFNYSATNILASTTKQTAFLIRLAPSVSNSLIGDLGERDLLNRAQLLLQTLEITADTGTGGLIIEGVLNPQNYPTNVTDITWTGLQTSGAGGLPSFAQVASGGSVIWAGGASQTTTAITTQAFPTGSITLELIPGRADSTLNGYNLVFITATNYATYVAAGLQTGQAISGSGIAASTVINNFVFWGTFGGVQLWYIVLSRNATGNTTGTQTATVTASYPVTRSSVIFFQKASWEATNATVGSEVNTGGIFPAGTFTNAVRLFTFFATQYYRVSFNQSSDVTTITPGSTTVTFKFGQPPFAQPGEQVFSFIAAPGTQNKLELGALKELTNTVLGGRGAYPNGPDVLAVNIYRASGSGTIPCNLVLRWSEAQA